MNKEKNGYTLRGLLSGLLLSAIATLTPTSTHAGILSVSNQVTVISPPPSAIFGAFSNGNIFAFPERTAFSLSNDVAADISSSGVVTNNFELSPTNILAGTVVNSYFLHHGGTTNNTAAGSVTFGEDVIGVICLTPHLVATHPTLGAPGTTYRLSPGLQGYELGANPPLDGIILSPDRRTITLSTTAFDPTPDDVRVLTLFPPPPLPPVAIAQSNQIVFPGSGVALVGFFSFDPNTPPLPLTYTWTQLSGPPVTPMFFTPAFGFFTAPAVPDSGAVIVYQLEVSNGFATSSNFIVINIIGINSPPIADAGPNQTVGENSVVTLDGSNSSDFNLDTLTLQWSQISGPVVTLTNADTVNPTFTAPHVTGAPVTLGFQLVVNDGQVNSGPSDVTITVTNNADVPIANAGTNQTVNELSPVTLDGTGSSDPGGQTLTYSWTQLLGEPVALDDPNSATPSFTSPSLGGGGTNGGITLTFRLTVSNGETNSTSTVDILVNNINHAPVADAEPKDVTLPSGLFFVLIASNSFDPDGDLLSYSWIQTSGPSVTLIDPTGGSTFLITPNVPPSGAALTFELTVSDGFGGVSTDDLTVNVTYVNHSPTANAGTNQTVNEGAIATLAGTASDPDTNELSIQWTEISGPSVTLINDTTLTPSFIAPSVTRAETNIVLELSVDDGFGGSATSDVSVHIANVNHAPVAQPPANLTVPEASSVQLVGQGTDPDSEEQSQLVYSWTQTAGPSVSISGSGATINFTSPLVTGGGDTNAHVILTFVLTVTDPNGASGTNSVNVVVANVDHTPTAVAGNNLTVNEGSSVTLNGSASSDPDSDPLTYSWVQVSGPAVTLTGANTTLPQFTAPFVSSAGATLQFRLTVNDGFGGTNSATTSVTVNNINDPPNVDHAQPSTASLWPPNHKMISISILGVIDPNHNATITITGVTQDEPTNGNGDGDTDVDAVINNDGTVLLRSERDGGGNGRVYHVHFTASDFEGSASGIVKVVVPHNNKGTAIDGGELYDSTQ